MHVRSLIPFLLLVTVALFLAGCGGERESQPESQPLQETEVVSPEVTDVAGDEVVVPEPEVPSSDEPAVERPGDAETTGVVAYVNGRPILREEFDRQVESTLSQYRQVYAQFGQDIDALISGVGGIELRLNLELQGLESLVGREALLSEADELGVSITDEEAERRFQELFAEYLESREQTEQEFAATLEAMGADIELFLEDSRRSVRDQMVAERIRDAVIEEPELTEEELETFFEKNRTDYEEEEEIRASHILLETLEEAGEVLDALEAGGNFAELAEEHSIGPSAPTGGDLGWFSRGMMVEPFEVAAFGLKEGEISGIVETEFGFHIILLTGQRPAFRPTLDEVRDQVLEDAIIAATDEEFRAWFEGVYNAATVDVELPVLAALRLKREDPDASLAALELVLTDESVDEPFLPFFVATGYEEKMQSLLAAKESLEAEGSDDPDRIAELEAEIESAKARAIELYEGLLEKLGPDPDVQARLDILAPSEPQTPSETAP
jgi:parvulin-like peptidyl-prolyl isomerase